MIFQIFPSFDLPSPETSFFGLSNRVQDALAQKTGTQLCAWHLKNRIFHHAAFKKPTFSSSFANHNKY